MKTVEFKLCLSSEQTAKVIEILDDLRWIYNTAVMVCQEDFQRYLAKQLPQDIGHASAASLGSIKVPGGKAKEFALYCPLFAPRDTYKREGYSVPIRPLASVSVNVGLQNIKASFSGNERGITCEETISANWLIPLEVRTRLLAMHSAIRANAMAQAIKAQVRFKTGLAKKPKLKGGGSDSFSSWAIEGSAISVPLPKGLPVESLIAENYNTWLDKARKGDRLNLHTIGDTKVLHFTRRWENHWILRSYRIVKKASGFFIQFVVIETSSKPTQAPSKEVVGLSLSTNSQDFVVDSLERVYSFRESVPKQKRLARLLKKLERQRKQAKKLKRTVESNRMTSNRQEIAKLHEKVAARRKGWGHLRTTRIVREFGKIGVARPTSNQISKDRNNFHKILVQPAPGAFTGYLEQKSKKYEREILVESLSDYLDRTNPPCPQCEEGQLIKKPSLMSCNKCNHFVPTREWEAEHISSRALTLKPLIKK